VELSNLGALSVADIGGAQDVCWAQGSSPFAPALLVNAISCEKGMTLTSAFRDGAAVGQVEVEKIHRNFEGICTRLAEGYVGDVEGLTEGCEG